MILMKKKVMILLVVSLVTIVGCGKGNLQSEDYSNQIQSDISHQSDINTDNQINASNQNFILTESDNYDNKNIIICEAKSQDRIISESLDDISANSTQIINATIESVSYETIQGNPWTKFRLRLIVL